jgi:hypothetical protein
MILTAPGLRRNFIPCLSFQKQLPIFVANPHLYNPAEVRIYLAKSQVFTYPDPLKEGNTLKRNSPTGG